MKTYFDMTCHDALESQQSSMDGLTSQQSEERLQQYGKNQLAEGKKKGVLAVFFSQLKDLLVLILLVLILSILLLILILILLLLIILVLLLVVLVLVLILVLLLLLLLLQLLTGKFQIVLRFLGSRTV